MKQRLGHRLSDRHSKGMVLTPAGKILLDHARLLAFEMQVARDQFDALRGLRRGVVRIGAVAAVMRTFVARAVAKLLKEFPDLSVEMMEGTDGDLLNALLDRKLELVVTASRLESDAVEVMGTCAYSDQCGVFCASPNPISDHPSMADLAEESLVMPGPSATLRLKFNRRFRDAGLVVRDLERLRLINNAVETLVAPDDRRREFLGVAGAVTRAYKAPLPDDRAPYLKPVAVLHTLSDAVRAKLGPVDISAISARIAELLESGS